jgi:hypothetical protein
MRLAKHVKKSLLSKLECLQPCQQLLKNPASSFQILRETVNTIYNISSQNGLKDTISAFVEKTRR